MNMFDFGLVLCWEDDVEEREEKWICLIWVWWRSLDQHFFFVKCKLFFRFGNEFRIVEVWKFFWEI